MNEKTPLKKFGTRSLNQVRIDLQNPTPEAQKELHKRAELKRNRTESSR